MDNNSQGVNCLSIVGRLSTLQSVHCWRFHCTPIQTFLGLAFTTLYGSSSFYKSEVLKGFEKLEHRRM